MTLLTLCLLPVLLAAPQAPSVNPQPPSFAAFTQLVQQYVKLQKAVPHLRNTKRRKEIVDRQHTLALRIRESRATAKQGDIFTPEVSEEFRRVIRSTFQGANALKVRNTIRQEESLRGWKIAVNAEYPEHLPLTTLPPTLLRRLPQLPPEVAYRIVGHDLILQDIEARVVIDFIPGAIP